MSSMFVRLTPVPSSELARTKSANAEASASVSNMAIYQPNGYRSGVLALLSVRSEAYDALSRPSMPRQQYFSERRLRSGRWCPVGRQSRRTRAGFPPEAGLRTNTG